MKKLMAKTGTYQKDGQTKGQYTQIGVILSNSNGEYAVLDPTVNLAGIAMLQRLADPQKSKGKVMASIFDDSQQGAAPAQQSAAPAAGGGDFSDDVPFAPLDLVC